LRPTPVNRDDGPALADQVVAALVEVHTPHEVG
jgi:hypothetical protein